MLGLSGQGTTNWTRDENGGLISQRGTSAKHYYLTDGLGSVAALTDSSGNVTQTYKTDPFGVSTGGTGSVSNPWQFAGEYKDPAANANLYKVGARNYDPTLGRWTQQDPLDQPDDLQNANKYLYAASDPVNLIDPTGTFGIPDPYKVVKCVAAVGVAVGIGGKVFTAVKALGGVKKAAKLALKAKSAKSFAKAAGAAGAALLGVDTIKENCF